MTSVSTETMPMASATSALSRGRSGASSSSHVVVDDGDSMALATLVSKPFKIVDAQRELRMGLTAASLDELEDRAKSKFRIPVNLPIRIVLEVDGTEIDDNDYFGTLDPDTSLMILCDDERWTPYKSNFM
ncbi:Cell death activator CIDE-B [Orchesella cincta]|uniref:Cell death activator CIDE-B n=1 Tax=Orchesella cincta TaxID=48709 RepID=A0A1D2MX35_ORCCI|nr:Cell death activator CIDE-B [Orchesella cincta]